MTTTENATRPALPALPVVYAKDMLFAQGYVPTPEELAAIVARADFFESEDMSREVHVKVVDVYTGVRIGSLIFTV